MFCSLLFSLVFTFEFYSIRKKTTTCHSLVRLLPSSARIVGGRIELDGKNLLDLGAREMREVRGRQIARKLRPIRSPVSAPR